MSSADQYELLDFGDGRKLERFGDVVLDRPSPAAEGYRPSDPSLWTTAAAHYQRTTGERGRWTHRCQLPDCWPITFRDFTFNIKLTPFGHVGLFAEQQANWQWIATQCQQLGPACRVLNLFAYTGGSTLAAARGGAEVVHIDAAKNVVQWARQNAELSGLGDAPVRWIAEDASKFVERELRRGNQYQGIILDPPSYGHGPKGERWQIAEHLPRLLAACQQLLDPKHHFVLFTSHSPQHSCAALPPLLTRALPTFPVTAVDARPLQIADRFGKHLPSGTGGYCSQLG